VAPSGYIIDILTNGRAEMACAPKSTWRPSAKIGTLHGLVAADVYGVSRPLEIWMQDATWLPVQLRLVLAEPSDEDHLCGQSVVDYGGEHPVYVGSGDNSVNPTRVEFDEAAAILTSVQRQ
jgi:hypothetical protein